MEDKDCGKYSRRLKRWQLNAMYGSALDPGSGKQRDVLVFRKPNYKG